jgi:hypothetical protein
VPLDGESREASDSGNTWIDIYIAIGLCRVVCLEGFVARARGKSLPLATSRARRLARCCYDFEHIRIASIRGDDTHIFKGPATVAHCLDGCSVFRERCSLPIFLVSLRMAFPIAPDPVTITNIYGSGMVHH